MVCARYARPTQSQHVCKQASTAADGVEAGLVMLSSSEQALVGFSWWHEAALNSPLADGKLQWLVPLRLSVQGLSSGR